MEGTNWGGGGGGGIFQPMKIIVFAMIIAILSFLGLGKILQVGEKSTRQTQVRQ